MTKLIASLIIGLSLMPAVALAKTPPPMDGVNPALLTMPWGLTGGATPTFAANTSISDGYGHTITCPWFYAQGCYNYTATAWYKTTQLPYMPR